MTKEKEATSPTQMSGEAIEKFRELVNSAQGLSFHTINTKGIDGMPDAIEVAFDHRSVNANGHGGKGLISLKDEMEKFRLYPARKKGAAEVVTLASFIDLTSRHKTEHSVIFASAKWPDPSLSAVIDYHEKDGGKPQFGQHRIGYEFPLTDEFKAWIGNDKAAMSQHDFAAFIEERIADLAEPGADERKHHEQMFQGKMATPAEMMALSRGLEIHVAGTVANHTRLSSGEGEVVFKEEHQNSSGEKVTVPNLFMVAVQSFVGGEKVRLLARLRYRVSTGSIVWFYQLYRWQDVLRDRVVGDLKKAAEATGLPTYEGWPEE